MYAKIQITFKKYNTNCPINSSKIIQKSINRLTSYENYNLHEELKRVLYF